MKNRNFKLTNFAVNNKTTIYFFTVVLIILGISSYNSTPKESFPEIVFPYFSISTIYPGTSPSDMENLVTRPIEKQLKSVNGIKEITSNSIQDFSLILVEFETNIDNDEANQDVKEAVDKAKNDLPVNLLDDPEVTKIDISEFPVLNINFSGDLGLVKMKDLADELQDEIEAMQEVTRVDIVGALDREFQIEIDLFKMQAAGISFDQIERAVAFENMTISSGQVRLGGVERTLRIVGEFKTVEDIKNLLLKDGIYLRDIALVKDSYADRESYARLDGKNVITLNVIKKSGENLIIAIDKIKDILDEFQNNAPENLIITTTGDQSTMTRNNLSNLFNTIILGFIVVVVVLMFFMGVDNALFVAVSIPLSMLLAFIMVPVVGFTMNMVVLMGFILVLGIVVDNSIVVVENVYRHYMNTPNFAIGPAAKLGTAEVAGPVFSGTLTTMAPFIPLAFWPGIMGEFMIFIPVTLIITLIASMVVAYLMNPVFAVSFMKYRGDQEINKSIRKKEVSIVSIIAVVLATFGYMVGLFAFGNLVVFFLVLYLFVKFVLIFLIKRFQNGFLPRLINGYKKTITFLIKGIRPYIVFGSTIALLIFTFFLMGIKPPKIVLFPEGDPNVIYTYIVMPEGTDIEVTDSITKVVENKVFEVLGENNPDVESVIANVAVNAGEDVFQRSTQSKLAKVTINFVEYKDRTGIPSGDYLDALRENVNDIAGVQITVSKEAMGPPTGKPVNIEISGESFEKLIPIIERLEKHIDSLKIPGIEELKTDIEINKPELIIEIDRNKANNYGISTAYIGMLLRTSLYGKEISKIRDGEDEYDIRIRLQKKYRENIETLMGMKVVVPSGSNGGMREIPISAMAKVNIASSYGGIIHKDHKRVVTLASNVLSGYNANEIVQKIDKSLVDFNLEKGYEIKFTGEQKDQEENTDFLSWAFFMAILGIITILVFQFNSVAKPVIIIIQIIFSLIGVLLGIIIFGMDLSIILSGMGIIAVAGIVVKNAIILIDYTDLLIDGGMKKSEAIIKAGATRLTPVILTAVSTILGLLPLAIGMNIDFYKLFTELDPNIYFGGDSAIFWKPLAWTIIFGLSFATVLTLIVVPTMYKLVYARKEKN